MTKKYFVFAVCLLIFVMSVHVSKCEEVQAKSDDAGEQPSKTKGSKKKTEEKEEPQENYKFPFSPPPPVNITQPPPVDASILRSLPPMPFITYETYTFEGLDYDTMPKKIFNEYNDCFGMYVKCIRNRVYDHAICAYNVDEGWVQFSNHCHMIFRNCAHRVKKGRDQYGETFSDDLEYYNGDGVYCRADEVDMALPSWLWAMPESVRDLYINKIGAK